MPSPGGADRRRLEADQRRLGEDLLRREADRLRLVLDLHRQLLEWGEMVRLQAQSLLLRPSVAPGTRA